jgi:uncharacterized membrane protein YcaP (DUF421 family)
MTIIFIRAIILYILLIASVRLMGKHQIGELQPSELAITILISNIATLPVEDPSIPLITGLVPILTLASLDILMSWAGIKSRTLRKITCGKPVVIINNGIIDQKQMKELRFTSDDLIEALHAQNIFDINEVQFAVVETTGSVSVYQKYDYRTVTNSDMNIKKRAVNPPALIVDNGKIVNEALNRIQLGQGWLFSILKQEKTDIKDIFIMTADPDGKYSIIKKECKTK